jgi:hypothetical protein
VLKDHTQPIKRPSFGFNKRAKGQPKAPLVWHTGLSGVPPDSVRCTTGQCPVHQRTSTRTRHLREFSRPARYNSPDYPVYTGQCPVLQGSAVSGTRQPRDFTSVAPLYFTGLSGVHRTVRCTSGATAISAPTATCGALNARAASAEVRRAHTGTPDSKQYLSGVHRTPRRAHKSEAPTVRIQRQ